MNPDSSEIFVFAGEPSGDLHGEKLLVELWKKDPSLKISGVGGPRMRRVGLDCSMPMENFQVMGFLDVFLALPRLIRHFYTLRTLILRKKPDLVLFIDYPGFNLRMAASLRKKGFTGKLCHFISPSVWAWKKNRIFSMAKTLDLLLVIFPFEVDCFKRTTLPVIYVGHPLIKRLENYPYQENLFHKDKQIIGLFPGSRKKELLRNLPLMLRVAKQLQQEHRLFALSLSEERFRPLIENLMRKEKIELALIPSEKTYDLMKACHCALAKSGTVTLELALHGVPTVVIYQISTIDLFLARRIFRIHLPFYCIVNIIAEKEIYPELIGPNLTEQRLLEEVKKLLHSPHVYATCQKECATLAHTLQDKDASHEAAAAIHSLLFHK